MKLDNEQKVLLCQKALYAKQLEHYAELCDVYNLLAQELQKELKTNDSPESLSEQVQKYYGYYLSQAAQGDLSFLEDENCPIFNDRELSAFKKFASSSMKINYFRDASELLHSATHKKDRDGHVVFSINEKKMNQYHTFLNPPRERFSKQENAFFDNTGRTFSKMIAENPKRWIGHTYFKVAINALKTINEIDSNHIASLNTRNISLTPKSFGATITGARGNITPTRSFSSPKQEFRNEIKKLYTDEERAKYRRPVSPIEDLGANIYSAGYRTKEAAKSTYKAHKGTLKKAAVKAFKIGAALGMSALLALAVKAGIDAHNFNLTSADANSKLGYHVVVSQDTLDRLNNIESMIDEVDNSSAIPSTDQLYEVRDELDETIDLVIEDLVRNSFEEQYPNLTISENGIETHYDKSHADPDDGRTGNYIYITCHDSHGKEYRYTITNFTSQGENRTDKSFDNEYDLDHVIPGDIADTAHGPYKTRTEATGDVISDFRQILQDTIELAGTEGLVDIPQAEYDNAKAVDKENIVLYLKAKFSIFKPEFRLVTPEKTQKAETLETSYQGEHDDR